MIAADCEGLAEVALQECGALLLDALAVKEALPVGEPEARQCDRSVQREPRREAARHYYGRAAAIEKGLNSVPSVAEVVVVAGH